jgi:hypothetical protein
LRKAASYRKVHMRVPWFRCSLQEFQERFNFLCYQRFRRARSNLARQRPLEAMMTRRPDKHDLTGVIQ